MREVKVGQVWKWFESDDAEFEVLAVGTNSADILYLGDGGFRATRPLHYWDDVSILLRDVEEAPETDAVNHPSHYNSDPTENFRGRLVLWQLQKIIQDLNTADTLFSTELREKETLDGELSVTVELRVPPTHTI